MAMYIYVIIKGRVTRIQASDHVEKEDVRW